MEDYEYGADSIQVLKGLQAIRKRPGIYIGSTENPINQNEMIKQALCHAFDEYMDGQCQKIEIILNLENIFIEYDAPMPLDDLDGVVKAELMMTKIHACRNLKKHMEVGNEFCHVGLSVSNALSALVTLETCENKRLGYQSYSEGEAEDEFKISHINNPDYTRLIFYPDRSIFKVFTPDEEELITWLHKVKERFTGLSISLLFYDRKYSF